MDASGTVIIGRSNQITLEVTAAGATTLQRPNNVWMSPSAVRTNLAIALRDPRTGAGFIIRASQYGPWDTSSLGNGRTILEFRGGETELFRQQLIDFIVAHRTSATAYDFALVNENATGMDLANFRVQQ